VEVETFMDISSRLIVNQASFKTKAVLLKPLIEAMRVAALVSARVEA
jgi:ATP phosphoribosyltransferase